MTNWNLEKIKEIKIITENNYLKIYNPWLYLSQCGWDKYEYDKYMLQYRAGALVSNELRVMELLNQNIQLIIGHMTSLASRYTKEGKPMLNPAMVKITIDYFSLTPTSKIKTTDTQTKIEKIKKYQAQQQAQNDSPIKLTDNIQ